MEKKLLPDDLFSPASQAVPIRTTAIRKPKPQVSKAAPAPGDNGAVSRAAKNKDNLTLDAERKTTETAAPLPKTSAFTTSLIGDAPRKAERTAAPKKAPQKPRKTASSRKSQAAAPKAAPKEQVSSETDRKKLIEQFLKSRGGHKSDTVARPVELKTEKLFEETERHEQAEKSARKGVHEEYRHGLCPVCEEKVPVESRVCPQCYSPIVHCPYCSRRAGALEDPKMVTEQRFNRILKQYTLFGFALPSMPIQPILDCSCCKSRVIICETCGSAMKHTAQSCPLCGQQVRMTKMLINPITMLETILRRPDALKGLQRLIDIFLSSQSK